MFLLLFFVEDDFRDGKLESREHTKLEFERIGDVFSKYRWIFWSSWIFLHKKVVLPLQIENFV